MRVQITNPVYRVYMNGTNPHGQAIFINFLPTVPMSFEQLVHLLNSREIVPGHKLSTKLIDAGSKQWLIVRRDQFALGRPGVGAIERIQDQSFYENVPDVAAAS